MDELENNNGIKLDNELKELIVENAKLDVNDGKKLGKRIDAPDNKKGANDIEDNDDDTKFLKESIGNKDDE